MNQSISVMQKNDKWIPWLFVLFFAVIALVDGTFVTIAIRTQTGLVTDAAYEKGLAYNNILDEAAAQKQADLIQKAAFEKEILSWRLFTKEGRAINTATARVKMFRPAQDGNDFEVSLDNKGNGLYETRPQFPLPGLWTARLEAQWQESPGSKTLTYKTTLDLIAR